MAEIIFVTGGARSGKSSFGERYAAKYGKHIAYIATAEIYDEEMRYRVELHRRRRPADWVTYEAPRSAEQAIMAANQADFILFDCLTLYVSNMLCAPDMPEAEDERYAYVRERMARLLAAAEASSASCVLFVTNEVGMGIVPENEMARTYRDLAGLANQMTAAKATEAYLVVSGLAVEMKKIAINLED